jgi:DNA-binding NarL/FixJ family response regulator
MAFARFETVRTNPFLNYMKKITVLLAEDHLIVREGFRGLLKGETDIEIVGEAENGRQAVQLTKKLRPAVVVMDIAMPQLNGLEATRQILQALPVTKVIILSAHADDAYIDQATAAGAAGYLIKQASSHALCEAIRAVQKGETFFSPSIRTSLKHQYEKSSLRNRLSKKRSSGLSSREAEVLQLIAEGKANKETAAELGISIKTVEKHRQRLMQKLNIHDTAGLTRYAVSAGIIESSVQLTIV